MTKLIYAILLIFLTACFAAACGCVGDYSDENNSDEINQAQQLIPYDMRIITEESPPFNYMGQNGRPTGWATDTVNEILLKLNQKADIEIMPWSMGYELLQTGPSVVLYSATRTDERENLFKWAGPVAYLDYTLYEKNQSGHTINSLEAAKKTGIIGVVKDDSRHQFLLENNFENIKVFETDADCLKSLIAGNISLWLGSRANADAVSQSAGISRSSINPVYNVRNVELYIAFSPDTPDEVVKKWQDALDELKANGEFDKIREKYNIPAASKESVTDFPAAAAQQALNAMISYTDGMIKPVLLTYEVLLETSEVKSGEWEKISPLLAALEKNQPDARTWYALPNGSYYTVVDGLTSANLKSRPYFPDVIAGNVSVGYVVVSHSTGKNTGIVAVPVTDEGSTKGILGASLYLDTLSESLREKIPQPFLFFAIDNEGKFAIHSEMGKISQGISAYEMNKPLKDAFDKIYAGKSGAFSYNDKGVYYNAVFQQSSLTGWHFAVVWPA